MNLALASLLALILAIVLSMFSRLNVGLIAIALAWLLGVYLAGMKPEAVMAGFPATLFLMLTGVTLLFACAEANGTLERLAHRAVGLARGHNRLLPILFFIIAMALSTVGPGAIAGVALVIPLAMVIGNRAGVPSFLTALMVANGANAGNLSPISALGVIANTKMAEGGVGGHEYKVWFANFSVHALVSVAAYLWMVRKIPSETTIVAEETTLAAIPMSREQKLTMVLIGVWIVGVLGFKLNVGLSAFATVVLLALFHVTDETVAIKKVPWNVILMVCGVSLLISLLEKTGGMEQFTALIGKVASPATINGIIAFIVGAISTYSSTSGVVMPAFLPIASKLAEQVGGDPLAIGLSINVGSGIVDVSPLSTLGALCIATINDTTDSKTLFRQMLIWGLAMTFVGALFSQLFAGLIARI
ncbi:MAG: SLC13 family permease [Blastocatellia bacterium]